MALTRFRVTTPGLEVGVGLHVIVKPSGGFGRFADWQRWRLRWQESEGGASTVGVERWRSPD
jgi:hypothetical protein